MDIWFIYFILFVVACLAFTLSTISGGGGALLQIPILNMLVGTSQTAPILNFGTWLSRPVRVFIFWKYIHWNIFFYYVPAAIIGVLLAAWLFSKVSLPWLQLVVGLFLISTLFQYQFGKKQKSFKVVLWYFLPIGLLVGILGTFTGGMGPILNPFLLNAGITKEQLIGTKAAQSFFVGLTQVGSYWAFGLLHNNLLGYGLAIAIGAIVGTLIGKRSLAKINAVQFKKLTILFMVISGVVMVIKSVQLP